MQLYQGKTLRFTALDVEKDAPAAAAWSWDPEVSTRLRPGAVCPLRPHEARAALEEWQREMREHRDPFVFAVREREGEALVGLARVYSIGWIHGAAVVDLILSGPQTWESRGREALGMLLNIAFDELNLYRVTARVTETDAPARAIIAAAGFSLEVRQRQGAYRAGSRVDWLNYGLLRSEWEASRETAVRK